MDIVGDEWCVSIPYHEQTVLIESKHWGSTNRLGVGVGTVDEWRKFKQREGSFEQETYGAQCFKSKWAMFSLVSHGRATHQLTVTQSRPEGPFWARRKPCWLNICILLEETDQPITIKSTIPACYTVNLGKSCSFQEQYILHETVSRQDGRGVSKSWWWQHVNSVSVAALLAVDTQMTAGECTWLTMTIIVWLNLSDLSSFWAYIICQCSNENIKDCVSVKASCIMSSWRGKKTVP